jgi:hypothetical protein
VTSPDFESGAYTNFATPAVMDREVGHAILGAAPSHRQPKNVDFPPTLPSLATLKRL